MNFLLDTNILVFLLRGKYDIKNKIKSAGIDNCYISEITLAELIYGAYYSEDVNRKLEQVRNLTRLFKILPITESIDLYGYYKSELRKKGELIDDFDLLIATTALAANLILVTDNLKHFQRLPLTLENWVAR